MISFVSAVFEEVAKEWQLDNTPVLKPTIEALFDSQYKEKMMQPGLLD